mmetsp:Transcript_40685/g.101757  ORF Transcript_40685/g.101757 Transcript_40685/m.101757 type:complete len:148 (+) Transcript_40685:13-456(+)
MSLEAHVARRAMLSDSLVKLEKEIFDLEGQYLEETANTGNILRGWEGYFQSISQQRGNQVRPNKIKNSDRIFSLSSVTAPKPPHQPEDDLPAPGASGTANVKRDKERDRRSGAGAQKKQTSQPVNKAKLGRKRQRNESDDEEDQSDG